MLPSGLRDYLLVLELSLSHRVGDPSVHRPSVVPQLEVELSDLCAHQLRGASCEEIERLIVLDDALARYRVQEEQEAHGQVWVDGYVGDLFYPLSWRGIRLVLLDV